jgi:hypothetical protein
VKPSQPFTRCTLKFCLKGIQTTLGKQDKISTQGVFFFNVCSNADVGKHLPFLCSRYLSAYTSDICVSMYTISRQDEFFIPQLLYYIMRMAYKKQSGTMEHDEYLLNETNE